MGRRKTVRSPVEVTLDRLEAKHTSGPDSAGRRWNVRGAPIGAVLRVRPGRKQTARRLAVLSPAADAVEPPCPVFGLCGGCQLQEMPLEAQRRAKHELALRLVGDTDGVVVHPMRGPPQAYGYRNKVELSFGPTRFIPDDQLGDPGVARDGSFLGFHPPGWFSRIVPLRGCPLATDEMNVAIEIVASAGLAPAWDSRQHRGTWRHLVVRQGQGPDGRAEVLLTLITTSEAQEEEVAALAAALARVDGVSGVLWVVTDRLGDVAEGELRAVLHGRPELGMPLGDGRHLRLPAGAFYQVNTAGSLVLFETISEALGLPGGRLLDLYCGVGAIGLALAEGYDDVVGIELNADAIETARANAARLGVPGQWRAGAVEAVLPDLAAGPAHIVVDPPRAGLHPGAARYLAEHPARVLVYVACNPAALGRDRAVLEAGGWRLEALWSVDLFPQTHHLEAVARFVR